MKFLILYIPLYFCLGYLYPQPLQVKINYNIIIDTDCGVDDYRALSILLSRPEIHVKGILISGGNVDPQDGYEKVTGFLKESGRESIPVGCGRTVKSKEPAWRNTAKSLQWSKLPGNSDPQRSAVELASEILKDQENQVSFLCLGPLTNVSDLIKEFPELTKKTDRIIWYNNQINPFKGFNYQYDSLAALNLAGSKIRLDIISNLGNKAATFDTTFISDKNSDQKCLALSFRNFFEHNKKWHHQNSNPLILHDELASLYLIYPSLFDMNPLIGKTRIRYNTGYDLSAIKELINDLIYGRYTAERNIVFSQFPARRELFTYDVRQILDSAISKYGFEEWKACVMTDEFHGHLGVFSIVGAKMGIKARELLGAGPDQMKVITYAGTKPPYSCLTDGIQVSTGSTLGMGLITVAQVNITSAMAEFSFNNRTIRISLKEKYLKQVESDINEGIVKFGLMDDGYWKMVRQSALKYWLEWDRNEIFEIKEID